MIETAIQAGAGIPGLDLDPFDERVLADPYPFYARMRELGPVFWVEKYGCYGTARHSTVRHVLKNWQMFTSTRGVGMSDITKPGAWREKGLLVEEDPPVHTQMRNPMRQVMTPRRLLESRNGLLRAADAVLDDALAKVEVDAVPALSERFVLTVFPDFLGIEANWEALMAVGAWNLNTLGPNNRITQDSAARAAMYKDWLASNSSAQSQRAGGLGEDFFRAEMEGVIAPGMAYQIVRTLLRAGTESTIASLGTALMHLAKYPAQYDLVRENPNLVGWAFDESLRLETPTQTLFRTTNEGATIDGVPLKPGTKLQFWLGSANRDPDVWSDPDDFQVQRANSGSMAFGLGVHTCFGAMVAKMEAECFLTALVNRVKRIELTGAPRFRPSNVTRILDSLPVRLIG